MTHGEWQAALRPELVSDLLRPARLARDVERGVLGQILARSEWPERRYPMLAAWTEQWSRPGDESPDTLPIVHARLPSPAPVSHTTRIDVHPVQLRRISTTTTVPVAHARPAPPQPTPTPSVPRAAQPAPTPTTPRPAQPTSTPVTPHPTQPVDLTTLINTVEAARAPQPSPPARDPPRRTDDLPRDPPRRDGLPRIVAAFRRLSEGPGDSALPHPSPVATIPAIRPATEPSSEPVTARPASDPGAPPPRTVTTILASPPYDAPLVHRDPAAPSSPEPSTSSPLPRTTPHPLDAAAQPPFVHSEPRTAPAATRVTVTPHAAAAPADPTLVHPTTAREPPTDHEPSAPAPRSAPTPASPSPAPVVTARLAARPSVRAAAPPLAVKAQWVTTADPAEAPRTHPRPLARASLELPHPIVTPPSPSREHPTPATTRPVLEASRQPTAPQPAKAPTPAQPAPSPTPPVDVEAVVDGALRRLGRGFDRARDLRRAIR